MTRWISDWRPDEAAFWESKGKRVARRNLVFSILAEHLGFTVWTVWSVVATRLGSYEFTTDQLFWLTALPNLIGSALRIPYTFGPARFGGRNFTVFSALMLVIPAIGLAFAVNNPTTPFWLFLVIAATAGVGGGNFASSMANITYFYPQSKQGSALGLNAAGGNIGVSTVQIVMPLVIAGFGIAAAGWFWVPLAVVAAVCAWLFMDNLTSAKASPRELLQSTRSGQTWIMSFLYIGTFGSFIGYSTAFPLLAKSLFPGFPAWVAFAGPLIGSLIRPVGGWLSDRLGGARVTLWNFAAMGVGVMLVWGTTGSGNFWLFFLAFQLLFLTAGIGNGSTYRMIPAIFRTKAAEQVPDDEAAAAVLGKKWASAAIGIISAVGAFGGFLINRGFGMSFAATGSPASAFLAFALFYVACFFATWWCYTRTVGVARVPSLAYARV